MERLVDCVADFLGEAASLGVGQICSSGSAGFHEVKDDWRQTFGEEQVVYEYEGGGGCMRGERRASDDCGEEPGEPLVNDASGPAELVERVGEGHDLGLVSEESDSIRISAGDEAVDFTDDLRPDVGTLGILAALAVLDVGPL